MALTKTRFLTWWENLNVLTAAAGLPEFTFGNARDRFAANRTPEQAFADLTTE